MSFFNKIFSSIGIGSAKVDTKLTTDQLRAGEKVSGVVEITGGNMEQQIAEIYLSLVTTYIKESNDRKITKQATIEKVKIVEPFTIGSNERREFPFSFVLPLDTPATLGRTKVWIHTGLDIKNAVDPSDKDYISVSPSPLAAGVLNAVYDLGFSLRKVDCEAAPYRLRRRLPFVQEFEFVSTSGQFRGRLDEVEVMFFPQSDNKLEVMMQIDRRARGLSSFLAEAMDMDECFVTFTLTSEDLPTIKSKINQIISRYS
ncbi:sporulation protein [Bacillus timonensis]|uniref:sporulation protein n=1 Tax=Bacillus timonensis TaxID=1033734 RepID=UPI0002882038|nr:sporulation protein [Bacillus timonensis]